MFQSRWGFHPCDYATYRKLKLLHSIYHEALRKVHSWERWHRKDPHNRVMRRRICDDKGQCVGYEPPVPLSEPSLCPIYSRKGLEKRHVDKKGTFFKDGFMEEVVRTDDFGIVADYKSARKPVKESSEVQPLRVSGETIDALYEQARKLLRQAAVRC